MVHIIDPNSILRSNIVLIAPVTLFWLFFLYAVKCSLSREIYEIFCVLRVGSVILRAALELLPGYFVSEGRFFTSVKDTNVARLPSKIKLCLLWLFKRKTYKVLDSEKKSGTDDNNQ